VGRAISQLPQYQKRGAQFLEPLIEERKACRGRDDVLEKPVGIPFNEYTHPLD